MNFLSTLSIGVAMAALVSVAHADQKLSDYTVAQLLEPCVEGDNDSRWGAAAEAECEQYVKGFTDAFILMGGDQAVCLPPVGNRNDEIRWAFVKWTHGHFDQRSMPAAEGLMAAVKTQFKCKG